MQRIEDMRIIEHIGLTRNEAYIYVELLSAGTSLAKDISKKTNMHRTSVYGCLNRLHKKGLVSVSDKNSKTYFEAVGPQKLMSLLKEREERLSKIIPALQKIRDFDINSKHEVSYFKGKQGLKTVFDDILKAGESYVGWGPQREIENILKYYFIHYIKSRQRKKIKSKLICFEEEKNKNDKSPLSEIKYLKQIFYSPTAHRVYGNNVAIILLESEPLAIVIRNKAIAESYRKHFKILWGKASK
jgi:HTH-type transcriptional regulator, sugar sensing transcriptional regulator